VVHLQEPKTSMIGPDAMHSPKGRPLRAGTSHHRAQELSNHLYRPTGQLRIAVANGEPRDGAGATHISRTSQRLAPLYTPEQRRRRDATGWTLVQGVLAPVQFAIFLVSLALVLRYLATGAGYEAAVGSVLIKTLALYLIMVTGAIWEREVFGCYLFAPAFFWEDVFSFLVLGLHTAYLAALGFGLGTPQQQMWLALAAYAAYVINATQFVLKLRAARRDEALSAPAGGAS
jgi:3-vinyl bacteriochlorophyllide hydratase